jgi:hypothetical protein
VTVAVLDDHLLRDLLAGEPSRALTRVLDKSPTATTNLYLYRLCLSVVAARGGALTGTWTPEQRRALGRQLVALPDDVLVVPMPKLAYRMAELADRYRLSTLGAEAVAAAEHLGAELAVWDGDDGPTIRAAMSGLKLRYRTLARA